MRLTKNGQRHNRGTFEGHADQKRTPAAGSFNAARTHKSVKSRRQRIGFEPVRDKRVRWFHRGKWVRICRLAVASVQRKNAGEYRIGL